jgi:hypothetical protein
VLVEELDVPLSAPDKTALIALARAGGPMVQRVLALGEDQRSIVYEAIEGPLAPAAALPAEAQAHLAPEFAALEATGIPLPDGRPVVLGPAGPVIQVVAPGAERLERSAASPRGAHRGGPGTL